MATYRLDVAYRGTGFHGYARQPGVRTVQGELEAALARIVGDVETFVAGRTDKGVHAAGNVVSFSTDAELDLERAQRSLNKQLGGEIAVLSLQRVADDFHARFSATERAYRYDILNREAPDPFALDLAWHVVWPLDIDPMAGAAAHLVGEHDFASFCKKADRKPTVREVRRASWSRTSEDRLVFEIAASSFCHQMVRSIVALCVDVGRGRLDQTDVPDVIAARDRNAAAGAAPPHGLTLMSVKYEHA